jgi:hypothetical protein
VAAVSYSIASGQNLEQVTVGTNAPSGGAGTIEIRIDQTANAVTDASYSSGTRPLNKGDIYTLIHTLLQYLVRDSNVFPGDNGIL